MSTKAPVPVLLERYQRLPPGPKLLLRLKSLLFSQTTRSEFIDCLKAAAPRTPDRKAWTAAAAQTMLDTLVGHDLLIPEVLICPPWLLHPIAVDAAASEDAGALAAAIRATFPGRHESLYFMSYGQSVVPGGVPRLIRLAAYVNDDSAFIANTALFDEGFAPRRAIDWLASMFGDVTLGIDWIATRQPRIQVALLEAKVQALLTFSAATPDLPALVAHSRALEESEHPLTLRTLLLRYDLLAGRLDAVANGLESNQALTDDERQAMRAAIAFVGGQNEAALAQFRDALKLRRKRLGKRKLFLPDEQGLFFLMAMLRGNNAALHPEMQAGIDAALSAQARAPYDGGLLAMQALLWLVQGMEARARELLGKLREAMPAPPLAAACVSLAEYALDPALSKKHRSDLAASFDKIRDLLPLVARIYTEVLDAGAHGRAPPPQDGLDAAFIAFTRLIEVRQPWERALESLDAFLGAAEARADSGKATHKGKRLAWFLDPETQEVTPAEQSAKGRDGWTDGRAVAMKRLYEQDPRLDYLTPQDRLALRTIRKEAAGWYGEDNYAFDTPRTIAALVGHKAVFHVRHRSQSLELVSYPLELLVTERRGGYRIALSHTADQPTVFLEPETPTRYRVIEFPQRMLAVQEILGQDGLTVPAAARDQVIAMVRRNNPALPIRAEIAEAGQPTVEAQPEPVVQLVPYEGGLKLSIVARPFGPLGPAYVAGVGGRSVLASIDGQQVRASRDLAAELARRAALVEACPTLRDNGGADVHDVVLDLESGLDVLLELRTFGEAGGTVAVEWPDGQAMRVSKLDPGKLKLRVGQDRDWFSVDGTVMLDQDQVLEMRFLLDRLDGTQGRFVALGDGRFVALTRQLQTQLQRLSAVSEAHKGGRRVHGLGAPALDAVLEEAGEVKTDAAWKRHVGRIRSAEGWTPKLPATLQAELRDYQVEGFVWMSRLARWGGRGVSGRRHGSGQDRAGHRRDAGSGGGGTLPGGRTDLRLSELGAGDRAVRTDVAHLADAGGRRPGRADRGTRRP